MKLKLVSFGKDRSGLFAPGVAEYAGRLGHYVKLELKELPESRQSGARAKEDEAQATLAQLGPKDSLIALDERGKALSSIELAQFLAKLQGQGRDVVLVIGGDEGLSETVRNKAALNLSLSAMTLPHRLARLVLVEQLYRAFTILKGEPYHK